jgi:hypothetical protein
MAERIVTQLIDDLSGAEIPEGTGERLGFSIRGVAYEIDLSEGNVAKFDKAFAPYIDAARKVRPRGRARTPSPNRKSNSRMSKQQLTAIRNWANKNGFRVSTRGRIPGEVVDAFEAAH